VKDFQTTRRWVVVAVHVALFAAAYVIAFLLRFDFVLSTVPWGLVLATLPLLLVIKFAGFGYFHLYESLLRYISMRDVLAILSAGTLSSGVFALASLLVFGRRLPWSVLPVDWIFCLALVGGVRLGLRAFREWSRKDRKLGAKRALVVGAGDAGEMLVRELSRSTAVSYDIVGFVDDDSSKRGRRLNGIEVLGTIDKLPELCPVLEIRELLIAIPSATREERQRILDRCRESVVPFKTVPALSELLEGKARIGQLQEVRPEDLLGREAVRLDVDRLRQELEGKRILVTGAAGSIGLELCRQVAAFGPERLVLFDRAESGLYFAELELKRAHGDLNAISIIGDIMDRAQVDELMREHTPDVVYHAAAYKHVSLMEVHPLSAIQNNIFGVEIVAQAARRAGVRRLVFISTDKAVHPVGIMGKTKRVAECLLLSLENGPTTFVAVRFGNVLGSDGSVLPLFKWQISRGGPVTVTDPEASRYFMLLSEAAQLVLQAGVMGEGGEVFFLDMGEPVRILDLANNLIRFCGLVPGRDVAIELTGLRRGERLREELVLEHEKLLPTGHEKVFMVRNHNFDAVDFRRDLELLRSCVQLRGRERAVAHLCEMALRY